MDFDRKMQRALQADAEKLRQLTGEDHTPEFLILVTCPHCNGSAVTVHASRYGDFDTYEERCPECEGAGQLLVDSEPITMEDLENM
jgi:DnaJ-class molecular chaperone